MSESDEDLTIRAEPRDDDAEGLISLHSSIYTTEFGLDGSYVEEMSAQFIDFFVRKAPHERLWIIEKEGEIMGSMGVLRHSDDTAVLRWLLLHPGIRGRGLGKVLMREAIDFSRDSGYSRAILWTLDILEAASGIYRSFGFEKVEEEYRDKWGRLLLHQMYQLEL
ncbi:MAG: GNAT family N-acetyltransferase [Thermoplasmatota archaeon]